jgi:hypothetical protein
MYAPHVRSPTSALAVTQLPQPRESDRPRGARGNPDPSGSGPVGRHDRFDLPTRPRLTSPSATQRWRGTMLARLGPRGGGGPALLKQIEDSARCVWSPAYGDLRACRGRRSPLPSFTRGRRTNPAHRKISVAGRQRCPNVLRQIVQGDRSEGASGPPDASISEGERTRCRVAPNGAALCDGLTRKRRRPRSIR